MQTNIELFFISDEISIQLKIRLHANAVAGKHNKSKYEFK